MKNTNVCAMIRTSKLETAIDCMFQERGRKGQIYGSVFCCYLGGGDSWRSHPSETTFFTGRCCAGGRKRRGGGGGGEQEETMVFSCDVMKTWLGGM